MKNQNYRKLGRQMKANCAHTFGACDTTGDCQKDWTFHDGACYHMHKEKMQFGLAKDYCAAHDGVLASVANNDENAFLTDLAKRSAVDNFYIGLYQLHARGHAFFDQVRLQVTKISNYDFTKEPTNSGGTRVMSVSSSGQWTWKAPKEELGFVCMRLARSFCAERPCGKHAYCAFGEKENVCKCASGYYGDPYVRCEAPCECTGIGDPHYKTYDGEMIHFMGTCRYILSYSVKSDDCNFEINVDNEDRRTTGSSGVNVSWTKTVYFKFMSKSVELRKDAGIIVDGNPVDEYHDKTMTIVKTNHRTTEIRPDPKCGIFYIQFDSTNVRVKLNAYKWRGKVNGICGDCDGDASNDLRTRKGLDVSTKTNRHALIGNSWRIASKAKDCDDHNLVYPECTADQRKQLESVAVCGVIKSGAEFRSCGNRFRTIISEYFSSCVIDNCVFINAKMKINRCDYLSKLDEFCRSKGFRAEGWRTTYKCPMTCPPKSTYTYDVPEKEESCASRIGLVKKDVVNVVEEATDMEGCVCAKGHVRSGGECTNNCGCKDDKGNYRNVGTKWISNTCTTEYTCAKTNTITKKTIKCAANAVCGKLHGKFYCVCKTGYHGDGFKSCLDDDECKQKPCAAQATCKNTPGSYQCTCNKGFEGDAKVECKDTNECTKKTHNCQQICTNTYGSFICRCNPGYALQSDKKTCKNINECLNKKLRCPANSRCVDTKGSYECRCLAGFRDSKSGSDKKNPNCIDVDECKNPKTYSCHSRATCQNNVGSYDCYCKLGYVGNGKTVCDDVNECIKNGKNSGICEHICINKIGSYECKCKPGYKLVQGSKCVDIDECKIKKHADQCHKHSNCINTPGSFQCDCKEGYRGEGRIECTPINKCEEERPCGRFMYCVYTGPGKYACKCRRGFVMVQKICQDVNECTRKNACHKYATCHNIVGSYTCRCRPGTKGDGFKNCVDINECALKMDKCNKNASTCVNIPFDYLCHCKKGYKQVNHYECTDINECAEGKKCNSREICQNLPGSYKCICKKGYKRVGKRCRDIIECDIPGGNNCAGRAATCINTVGSYSCKCIGNYTGDGRICTHPAKECKLNVHTKKEECKCGKGYVLSNDKQDCIDINECAFQKKKLCDKNARCFNLEGSYMCKCNEGYCGSGLPGECDDLDECANGKHQCDEDAICTNTDGSYTCQCQPGYSGDGVICVNINECKSKILNRCTNAYCTDTDGGYKCTCKRGFKFDENDPTKRICVDEDECLSSHKCDLSVSTCLNLVGSYTCVCKTGFKKINGICVNIDECHLTIDKCDVNAKCTDTVGSYTCECNPGFTGDGRRCSNINECTQKYICHKDAICRDQIGSYTCECKEGYRGDGKTKCAQVNECAEKTAKCDEHSKCRDTPGSYECDCDKYFIGSGKAPNKCELDLVDECKKNIDTCDDVTEVCVDLPKGFRCDCQKGYKRNGAICENIDECEEKKDDCSKDADCIDNPGSYSCKCKKGFSGDGKKCMDIDECTGDGPVTHNCDTTKSVCKNLRGDYECKCNAGYLNINKKMCKDDDECSNGKAKCDKASTICANMPGSYECMCKAGYNFVIGNIYKCSPSPKWDTTITDGGESSFYEF